MSTDLMACYRAKLLHGWGHPDATPFEPCRHANEAPASPLDPHWVRELAGMRKKEAIFHLAKLNGGVLDATEADRILRAAGLATGICSKSQVYGIIRRSGQFEKVRPAVYRLKEAAA